MRSVNWVTAMLLVLAGLAGAAQTLTDTYNPGRPAHTAGVNSALNGFQRGRSIVESALSIEGLGVENVSWRFNQNPGYLPNHAYNAIGHKQGLLVGRTDRFDLLPYQTLLQSISDASSNPATRANFIGNSRSGYRYLGDDNNDKMFGSFDLFVSSETSPLTPSTVPAPSAVVLGSIGIVLVGWLRKRASA